MTRKKLFVIAALVLTGAAGVALAATSHVVGQKDKKFTTAKLRVKAGDTVSFHNDDPYFHNIFSLSSVGGTESGTSWETRI